MGNVGAPDRFENFTNDELVTLLDALEGLAFGDASPDAVDDTVTDRAVELGNEAVAELRERSEDTSPWNGYFEGA